jgi:hypothetical protein
MQEVEQASSLCRTGETPVPPKNFPTKNQKPKTKNQKLKTKNRKPKTENRKPKTVF